MARPGTTSSGESDARADPSQIIWPDLLGGCPVIAAQRSNRAHLHRPWRAIVRLSHRRSRSIADPVEEAGSLGRALSVRLDQRSRLSTKGIEAIRVCEAIGLGCLIGYMPKWQVFAAIAFMHPHNNSDSEAMEFAEWEQCRFRASRSWLT